MAAYSVVKSQWDRIEFPTGLAEGVRVSVNNKFACVKTETTFYAFSGKVAKWIPLRLPMGSQPTIQIDTNVIHVTMNQRIYFLGENATQWSGIKIETGELVK